MDIQTVASFISSVGFPIVACGALYVMVRDISKAHKEEIETLRQTIAENTNVLVRLESIIKMLDRRNTERDEV